MYVFCIYFRTNSGLCHLQHKLVGFCNRDGKCLQRGTDWVFKLSSLRFVFKGLKDIVAFVLHVTYITLLLNTNDKKLRKK
jgi:hypothetical protein